MFAMTFRKHFFLIMKKSYEKMYFEDSFGDLAVESYF